MAANHFVCAVEILNFFVLAREFDIIESAPFNKIVLEHHVVFQHDLLMGNIYFF